MTEATRILNQGRAEGRAEGKAEGIVEGKVKGRAEGKTETLFENMQALMETMKWSAEQALAALKVPEDQYPKYLSMLK